MAEEHRCIQGPRITRLEDDVRRNEKEIDEKVSAVYAKYNGKIDEVNKSIIGVRGDIADLNTRLSLSTFKISMIIGVGSFFASLAIMFVKELIFKGK